jgi:hypothetical protein
VPWRGDRESSDGGSWDSSVVDLPARDIADRDLW